MSESDDKPGIMGRIKYVLIGKLIELLIKMIKPEMVEAALDAGLDVIEKKVQSTGYEKNVMALCGVIRTVLNIPDDDIDQSNPV